MASFAFRAVCLLLVALALCQGAVAAPDMTPAQQIRAAFVKITDMSDALRIKAEKIDVNNPLDGFVILSAEIGPGFFGIIAEVTTATGMVASMPTGPLGAADAKTVVVVLTTFVKVHQALLGVVIGKSGLLSKIPILSPIAAALRALEEAVDAFAFALINVIPTEADAAEDQFGKLTVTVTKARDAYDLKVPIVSDLLHKLRLP